MSPERVSAFAPGRVNLIGDHTDYNEGLALPFAISRGVTVRARSLDGGAGRAGRVVACAADLGERDEFPLLDPPAADGWRAFVRGAVAELVAAGLELAPAELHISGDVPRGAGLSSSAALEVALCLALRELARGGSAGARAELADRVTMARLCSRIENDWVGARTGLLDQLASLFGTAGAALYIDFRSLDVEPVPLRLGDWRVGVLHSGERHSHASSGYNLRRAEVAQACELLGIVSLRDADRAAAEELPQPLRGRALHVIEENQRVREGAAALRACDLQELARLLNASHASLRDQYEVSTPAVESAVARLLASGAAGARLTGGGFGGSVLGLFPPGAAPPPGTLDVRPGAGAHLLGG